ncbi:rRNA maturation RNase YbeY [uncultured Sphingomonas sp.]|uniref:rRNA maturation RNase YbeY n=1 Tax=uncultured Sphingomonas sp. TaxID=158754 RepID=UPI0035CA49FD
MLDIAITREDPWPHHDWDALAAAAAQAAICLTPYGDWLGGPATIEISVRLTTDDEVHALNHQYRHQDKPTNVLSFPMVQRDLLDAVTLNSDDGEVLLGDIVLAHDVCAAEAAERDIDLAAHAAHLIVHGTLHLLGYDHMDPREAEAMEEIEARALASLGIANPYLIHED